MLLASLIIIAVALTCAMFGTRQAMLGFPCALFWALTGAQAYTLSTVPWGDIYYYLAFGSLLGMTTFTALAAFGLREKRDTLADEEMEKGDGGYIDEGGNDEREKAKMRYIDEGREKGDDIFSIEGESKPSKRTRELRERARQRRSRD